jgi:hypothetical protein
MVACSVSPRPPNFNVVSVRQQTQSKIKIPKVLINIEIGGRGGRSKNKGYDRPKLSIDH